MVFMFICILHIYFLKKLHFAERGDLSLQRRQSNFHVPMFKSKSTTWKLPHIVKNTFLSTSNRSKVSFNLMFSSFFWAHPPLPPPTQQQSNGNKLCSMLDFVPHPHKQGSSAIAFKLLNVRSNPVFLLTVQFPYLSLKPINPFYSSVLQRVSQRNEPF